MSISLARRQPPFANRVFTALAVLSVVGMVVMTVTAIAGFEEPNTTLLLISAVLVLAAPLAMLVHLIGTRELTGREKRIWIRELAVPRAARTFSAYLTAHDRSAKVITSRRRLRFGRAIPGRGEIASPDQRQCADCGSRSRPPDPLELSD